MWWSGQAGLWLLKMKSVCCVLISVDPPAHKLSCISNNVQMVSGLELEIGVFQCIIYPYQNWKIS